MMKTLTRTQREGEEWIIIGPGRLLIIHEDRHPLVLDVDQVTEEGAPAYRCPECGPMAVAGIRPGVADARDAKLASMAQNLADFEGGLLQEFDPHVMFNVQAFADFEGKLAHDLDAYARRDQASAEPNTPSKPDEVS